jgi:hypothetical protein
LFCARAKLAARIEFEVSIDILQRVATILLTQVNVRKQPVNQRSIRRKRASLFR